MKSADKFENLKVFDEAHKLTLSIYKVTKDFPKSEVYGLTSQIRRSSASVAANIVEGNSRGHKKEFLQFLYLANGSLEETKYHLLLAKDLGYIDIKEYDLVHSQSETVGKLLTGLINYCKKVVNS
jgi:four helix bundle protein